MLVLAESHQDTPFFIRACLERLRGQRNSQRGVCFSLAQARSANFLDLLSSSLQAAAIISSRSCNIPIVYLQVFWGVGVGGSLITEFSVRVCVSVCVRVCLVRVYSCTPLFVKTSSSPAARSIAESLKRICFMCSVVVVR